MPAHATSHAPSPAGIAARRASRVAAGIWRVRSGLQIALQRCLHFELLLILVYNHAVTLQTRGWVLRLAEIQNPVA